LTFSKTAARHASKEVYVRYKGIILVVIIAIGLSVMLFLPERMSYKEIATIGSPAPDFELRDADGNLWRLSSLRGKVVFINFWATWCTVCRSEMPYKESLYEKMKDKPFQMLGILFRDEPRNLIPYLRHVKVSIPTLISPDDEVAALYGITGVPETFIVDKNGIIREKVVGPREWDSPENVRLIEKWL
jgi:peroxiredoxin